MRRSPRKTAVRTPFPTVSRTALGLVLAAAVGAGAAIPRAAAGVELDPRRAEAAYQFALAKMLAEEADFEQALAAFQRAVELDPDDPYVRLELGRFFADLAMGATTREKRFENLRRAAELVSQARAQAPANLDVLRVYAQIHLNLAELQGSALERALEAFEILRARTDGDLQVLVSLAQIHLWKRNFSAAAEVLREASAVRPDHGMIKRMLLDALLGSDALDEAEPLLRDILERDPSALEHRYTLAEVYSRQGRPELAVAVLDAAPADVRHGLDFNARLVAALHEAGDDARALEVLDGVARTHTLDDRLQRLRVRILNGLIRYDDAIAALDAWQPTDPDEVLERRLLLSRLYERVGRFDDAVGALRGLLEVAPERQVQRLESALAGVLERQGRRRDAIELLEARLAASDDRPVPLVHNLAELYLRAGRVDEAVAMLDGAIAELEAAGAGEPAERLWQRKLSALVEAERWPRLEALGPELLASPSPTIRLAGRIAYAEALAHLGRVDAALATLRLADGDGGGEDGPAVARRLLAQAVALELRFGRVAAAEERIAQIAAGGTSEDLFFAAQLWQQDERWERMVPLLEKVLEQEPEAPQALFALASAHERSGDVARAGEIFERLLTLVPDHAPTLNYLGYMWAERGENLERALALIRRAVALDPDNGAYADSLGWAHFQLGQYPEARRFLEWAARLMDDDPTIFEHLGDLYVALEQTDLARDSYRQALELVEPAGSEREKVRRKLDRLDG